MNGDCQFGERLLTLIAQADRACAFVVFAPRDATLLMRIGKTDTNNRLAKDCQPRAQQHNN